MSHWVQHDYMNTPSIHPTFQKSTPSCSTMIFPQSQQVGIQPCQGLGTTMLFRTWRKWNFRPPKDLSSSNSLAPGAPTFHVGQTAQGCEHFIGRPTICSKKSRPMVQILNDDLAPDSTKGVFFFCVFYWWEKRIQHFVCGGGDFLIRNEKEIYGNPDGLSIYHYCNLIVSSRNVPISSDVAVPQMSSTWRHWKLLEKTHTTGPPTSVWIMEFVRCFRLHLKN